MSPVAAAFFDLVSAPFWIAAALLVVAGGAKIHAPHAARRVLEALGLPASVASVRLIGAGEVALGLTAFVWADRWTAVVVALAYVVFAAVGLWVLVGRVDIASCGCLGALDTPPSALHVVLSLFAAVAAGLAAAARPVRIDLYVGSLPLEGAPFLIAVATGVVATVLAMAYVPVLVSSYTGGQDG